METVCVIFRDDFCKSTNILLAEELVVFEKYNIYNFLYQYLFVVNYFLVLAQLLLLTRFG